MTDLARLEAAWLTPPEDKQSPCRCVLCRTKSAYTTFFSLPFGKKNETFCAECVEANEIYAEDNPEIDAVCALCGEPIERGLFFCTDEKAVCLGCVKESRIE